MRPTFFLPKNSSDIPYRDTRKAPLRTLPVQHFDSFRSPGIPAADSNILPTFRSTVPFIARTPVKTYSMFSKNLNLSAKHSPTLRGCVSTIIPARRLNTILTRALTSSYETTLLTSSLSIQSLSAVHAFIY